MSSPHPRAGTRQQPTHRLIRAFAVVLTLLLAPLVTALPAAAAIAGSYSGPISGSNDRTVAFTLNSNGTVSGFDTQTYVYCSGLLTPMYWIPSGPLTVAADGSFSGVWYSDQGQSTEVRFEVSGTFDSSTTALGTARATMPNLPSCTGGETITWRAENRAPVYNPQITLTPATVTTSQLDQTGVQVAITGFPAEAALSLLLDGVLMSSHGANGSGAATATLIARDVAPGSHTVTVQTPDGTHTASATLTVTGDPVSTAAITLTPATQTQAEFEAAGFTVQLTGFRPSVGVWIRFDGSNVYLGSVDANGSLTVPLGTGDVGQLLPGGYTVRAFSEDYSTMSRPPTPSGNPLRCSPSPRSR